MNVGHFHQRMSSPTNNSASMVNAKILNRSPPSSKMLLHPGILIFLVSLPTPMADQLRLQCPYDRVWNSYESRAFVPVCCMLTHAVLAMGDATLAVFVPVPLD